jgi:hypothetical protein
MSATTAMAVLTIAELSGHIAVRNRKSELGH